MDVIEETSPQPTTKSSGNSIQEFSTDLLRVYYGRIFPYDALFNWLSYGNDPTHKNPVMDSKYFGKREWSFTIEDDIYIRYQSFTDKAEMIAAIQKRQPHKIDIGAIFTQPPRDHTSYDPASFFTTERELVFDIDMTDYDDIRTCCTGANICLRCWPYMTMALKVVDQALRADFGFRHILWIYSGRRGVHCWVSDEQARMLGNDGRSAVVEYLSIDIKAKDIFKQPHPMMRRAYAVLEPYFEKHICDGTGQGLLHDKVKYMKVLNELPDETIRTELHDTWEKDRATGAARWRQLKAATSPAAGGGGGGRVEQSSKRRKLNYPELEAWRMELVFTHCYPRLDANVSKSQNHLLKSPFCVHPKTGRVCVPIDPARADQFDPFAVPTVRTLCEEVDAYDRAHAGGGGEAVPDIEKTSMQETIVTFDRVFMRDLNTTIRRGIRDRAEEQATMAAGGGDF